MAELAGGAVRTLLGVINEEMKLLDRVEGDVQFIKEEMESMNSFLQHLSAGAEHSEQVSTWMKQVRDLAYDCSNSIDLYLQRGNPSLHRERGPLGLSYLWWVPWYLQKLVAKHSAAIQLRELKERARDVGERRLRYGVEVPKKSGDTTLATSPSTELTPWSHAAGVVEAEDDEDDEPVEIDASIRAAIADPVVGNECSNELVQWLRDIPAPSDKIYNRTGDRFASIAIAVAPTEEGKTQGQTITARALADYSASSPNKFCITFPEVIPGLPAGPFDILVGIMKQQHTQEEEKESPQRKEEEKASPQKEEASLRKEEEKVLPQRKEEEKASQQKEEASLRKEEEKAPPQRKEEEKALPQKKEERASSQKKERVKKELKLMQEVEEKIYKIKKNIKKCLDEGRKWAPPTLLLQDPLDILLGILKNPDFRVWWWPLTGSKQEKINKTAKKIRKCLESDFWPDDCHLPDVMYVDIISKELDPQPTEHHRGKKQHKSSEAGKDKSAGPNDEIANNLVDIMKNIKSVEEAIGKKGEDQLMKKIQETSANIVVNKLQELLLKPKETEKQGNNEVDEEVLTADDKAEQIMNKIDTVLENIKMELVREVAKVKIKEHLHDEKTIIVLEGFHYAYKWKEIKKCLSYLDCAAGSAVVVITRYPQGAEVFCNPPREPIVCSLSACYYNRVLQLTRPRKHNNVVTNYRASILRDILERCEPHGVCMKIFVRAMHANSSRDEKELVKLLESLVFRGSLETNAKKMIKFSYNDLPRDYKTCLLYLSIFPKGDKISRSRVAQRWVVEGLVSKEDRPSSLHQAKRCFDQLADRWLVCPANITAEGKVRSCTVHDLVREFITNRARKQHIMDPRLSQHLARHFSVLSNIRLRPSENIMKFLMKPSRASSQLRLLKVLDLEGSESLKEHQQYLSNVCNMIALLKFLSLRKTDITSLPKEINKLQQLEVLDIRQTKYLDGSAIKHLMLLKLKHLLAGTIVPSTDMDARWGEDSVSTVRIPHKIKRMTALRVLTHVQATEKHACELEKFGELWQLRKLGVVIDDSETQLRYLLRGISDLNESLQSLSIEIKPVNTAPTAARKIFFQSGGHSSCLRISRCTQPYTFLAPESSRQNAPKFLESLSISGSTNYPLLPFLTRSDDVLAKVTLQKTSLNQDDMEVLAKLKKLRTLRLRHIRERELLFKKKEMDPRRKEDNWFEALKYLVVEGGDISKMSFEGRAAHNLEKIVWSFGWKIIEPFSGLKGLPALKEIELNGDSIPNDPRRQLEIPDTVHIKLPVFDSN